LVLGAIPYWEWIPRQCEITFESEDVLRKLLAPGRVAACQARASFVTLLLEKGISTHGLGLECAVGMRLAFPPAAAHRLRVEPVSALSEFGPSRTPPYQRGRTWFRRRPDLFPPERFHFDV